MRNQFFESTLEKVARIMSRNYNVTVTLEGNQAYTDGKKIVLPMMEDLDDELRRDLEGFLDHEVAHVKFTDFEELEKPKRVINRFHFELFNALEDSRIEIELPKEYSGTVFNLERLNEKWGAKMEEARSEMPWPIRLIICIREIFDGKTPKTDAQIEPILAAVMPQIKELKRTCVDTKSVLDETAELIKAINLAREALSKGLPPISDEEMEEAMKEMRGESSIGLDPNRKDRKGQEAQGNEQYDPATERKEDEAEDAGMSAEGEGAEKGDGEKSDGEGQDGEGQDGDAEGTGKDGKSEDSAGDSKNKSLETHESITGKEGDDSKDLESSVKPERPRPQFDGTQELETRKNYAKWSESSVEKEMMSEPRNKENSEFDNHAFSSEGYMKIQLEKALGKEPQVRNNRGYYHGRGSDINAKHISLPYSREYDEVIDFTGKGDQSEYIKRKLKVMKHINPIKMKLERVLKVKENARVTGERERGQLNTRALAQMCIDKNYRKPFKQFTKEDTSNVAVTLLIDCSGSMSGDPMEVARQTALALGEALRALGMSFEALGFNTDSNYELARKVSGLPAETVARFNRFGETLRLMVFKRFDSNNLNGICKAEAGGANADGESIIWAAKRLAQRKEKRKILIVLSDGQPAYGGANHEVLAGDLKRVIKMLPKSGIEPIGIGICTEDPKLFYPNYLVVNDLSKLSGQVMGRLSKMLQDGIK